MRFDDLRRAIEATVSNLTPTKAQELAKSLLEPGAAYEQVSRTAADILEWSQRNRERLRELVRHEIQEQVRGMGVATQTELDALRKRVRELERAAGMTASGRKRAATPKPAAKRSTATRTTAGSAAKRKTTATGRRTSASARG